MPRHLTSTITSKGQITIPASIRHKLNLTPGSRVHFSVKNQQVSLTKQDWGPKLAELQSKVKKQLATQGLTADTLRDMAQQYHQGQGWEEHVKEKYGPSKP